MKINKIKINKIGQRIMSSTLSLVIILGAIPLMNSYAVADDMFTDAALGNHWGRSDIRAHLNGGLSSNLGGTDYKSPYKKSITDKPTDSNYAGYFTETELNSIVPFEVETNVFNSDGTLKSTYKTTDKFALPSGNFDNNQILSFGTSDISNNDKYNELTTSGLKNIIPISYWPSSTLNGTTWLRSPNTKDAQSSLYAQRGRIVGSNKVNMQNQNIAPVIQINKNNIGFASVASAANLMGTPGGTEFTINNKNLGEKTDEGTEDYGMYLKKKFSDLNITSVDLTGTDLTVGISDFTNGTNIVVCAYENDNTTAGAVNKVYAATGEMMYAGHSTTIDISNWNLSSLDGYTLMVWSEDAPSYGSMATATPPTIWEGSTGVLTSKGTATYSNNRAFSTIDNLQPSWGTLANPTDLVGSNPSNQKIYYGYDNGSNQPLQFWVASNSSTLTLYQAKNVDSNLNFNATSANYPELINISTISPDKIPVRNGQTWGQSLSPYTPAITGSPVSQGWLISTDSGVNWQKLNVTDKVTSTQNNAKLKYYAIDSSNAATFSNIVTVSIKNPGPLAPSAPTLISVTSTSVTLKAHWDQEYSKDNANTWQDSGLFENLVTGTEYSFITRIKQTSDKDASPNSVPLKVTPKNPGPLAPSTPTLISVTDTAVTLNTIAGQEYSKDNANTWQDSGLFGNLRSGTEYSFITRVKATNTIMPSLASDPLKVTTTGTQYITKTLTGSDPNITVTGTFDKNATLKTTKLNGEDENYDILSRTLEDKNIIYAYDIAVENGAYEPNSQLSISFTVDSSYNGKTITIKHKLQNGEIETLLADVDNGIAQVSVNELSPFMLAEDKGPESVATGNAIKNIMIFSWSILLVMSAAAIIILNRKGKAQQYN